MIKEFKAISESTGIQLDPMLESLFRDGRTKYGASREDWVSNWRSKMLNDPPALSSVYDFEWIDSKEGAIEIKKWLNPKCQSGIRFLPFAKSGAGDLYCLVHIDNRQNGVACVWHDRNESQINASTFPEFSYVRLIEALADFSHLVDEFSEADAARCIKADIEALLPYFPEDYAFRLAKFMDRSISHSEVTYGRRKVTVPCFITEKEAQNEYALLRKQGQEFSVVPRWEIANA